MNLADLVAILNEYGISDTAELRCRLSDDGRASAAWHDGYTQAFAKVYSDNIRTMNDAISRMGSKIEILQRDLDEVRRQVAQKKAATRPSKRKTAKRK